MDIKFGKISPSSSGTREILMLLYVAMILLKVNRLSLLHLFLFVCLFLSLGNGVLSVFRFVDNASDRNPGIDSGIRGFINHIWRFWFKD